MYRYSTNSFFSIFSFLISRKNLNWYNYQPIYRLETVILKTKLIFLKSPPQAPLGSGFCTDPPSKMSKKFGRIGGSGWNYSDEVKNFSFQNPYRKFPITRFPYRSPLPKILDIFKGGICTKSRSEQRLRIWKRIVEKLYYNCFLIWVPFQAL